MGEETRVGTRGRGEVAVSEAQHRKSTAWPGSLGGDVFLWCPGCPRHDVEPDPHTFVSQAPTLQGLHLTGESRRAGG